MDWKGYGSVGPWPDLTYCPGIAVGRMTKATKKLMKMVGIPSEIRTGHLPNTSEKRYRLSHLAVVVTSGTKAILLSPVKFSSFKLGQSLIGTQ